MFHFLETDIREQKSYEMKTQTYVDNTVNNLRYEILTKITFLLSETLLFLNKNITLGDIFF